MRIHFRWDEETNTPRATVTEVAGADLIAAFFESDLQGSVEATKEVLLQIDKVASGKAPAGFMMAYNATAIQIDPENGCLVEDNNFDGPEPPSASVSLVNMMALLRTWLAISERQFTSVSGKIKIAT